LRCNTIKAWPMIVTISLIKIPITRGRATKKWRCHGV
jgi:hypothetical protein